jgi:DNA invertase Pin-like site-specific DNA recombinase
MTKTPQTKIGYCRVSTSDQSLDLQVDALKKSGCETIYQETASGKNATKAARPELSQCLKALRAGDSLVVWRLDRLGRSLSDLVQIVEDLRSRGIELVSLSESIDTSSATGQLMFHIMGSLAEFERNLIRERTAAGLASARARGRIGGRPKSLGEKEIRQIRAMLTDPMVTIKDIAENYGVSRGTIYNSLERGKAGA